MLAWQFGCLTLHVVTGAGVCGDATFSSVLLLYCRCRPGTAPAIGALGTNRHHLRRRRCSEIPVYSMPCRLGHRGQLCDTAYCCTIITLLATC